MNRQLTACTVGVTSTVFGLRRKHEQALKTPDAMLAFVAQSASRLGTGFSVIGVGPGFVELIDEKGSGAGSINDSAENVELEGNGRVSLIGAGAMTIRGVAIASSVALEAAAFTTVESAHSSPLQVTCLLICLLLQI